MTRHSLFLAATVALSSLPPVQARAAAPAPALLQIYGLLDVNLQYSGAGGASAGPAADVSRRFAVSSGDSHIGLRGSADVGHGLTVVYQCETAANLDRGPAGLCSRDSRLGVSGGFGTIFFGNWDTPLKAIAHGTKAADPFPNADVFASQGIMGSPGYVARSVSWGGTIDHHEFDLRAQNSVSYWSPRLAGLSARLQWSTDEAKAVNGIVNRTLYGAAVGYDTGPLSAFAAMELHEDGFGLRAISGANGSDASSLDLAWRVGAGYELPLPGLGALTLSAVFEQLAYAQDDAADGYRDYRRAAWLVGAKLRAGSHELRARFAQALDPRCTLADGAGCPGAVTAPLGAAQLAAGYTWHVARSTQLYAAYTRIVNEDAARYTFAIGGSEAIAHPPAGADPSAFGIGIRHGF